jgi:uncharacterized membrane protein YphA (DoxX/SURF4 family)
MKTMRAIRWYLGVVFVVAGVEQWLGLEPWGRAADWPTRLDLYLQAFHSHPVAFYHAFLVSHKDVVAAVAPPLHVILGVLLLLGFVPRITAGVALAVLVSYMALTGFIMPWHPDPVVALAWLAFTILIANPVPIRFYIAGAFLIGTVGRIANWPGWHDEVGGFLNAYLPVAAPFYRPVMRLALAHVELFARLVFVGEAVAGISLLFGHAEVGMLLSLNYLLAKGNTPWSFNNDFAFLVGMLVVQCSAWGRPWRWRWWSPKATSPDIAGPTPSSASPPS